MLRELIVETISKDFRKLSSSRYLCCQHTTPSWYSREALRTAVTQLEQAAYAGLLEGVMLSV